MTKRLPRFLSSLKKMSCLFVGVGIGFGMGIGMSLALLFYHEAKHPKKEVLLTLEAPLHTAVKIGNTKMLAMLLTHPGIDINREGHDGYSLLLSAIRSRNRGMVSVLLKQPNIDVNKAYYTYAPLHQVVAINDEVMMEWLLSCKGVNVNPVEDLDGMMPLHIAVENEHLFIVALLLKQKDIDVNWINWHGNSPLDIAINKGNKEIVTLLLTHPTINLNREKKKYGKTLLCRAIEKGHQEIIALLFNHPKIDIMQQDSAACLRMATKKGNEEVTAWLRAREGSLKSH